MRPVYRVRVYFLNVLAFKHFPPSSPECNWKLCRTKIFRWRWRARWFAYLHSGHQFMFMWRAEIDEPRTDNVILFPRKAA